MFPRTLFAWFPLSREICFSSTSAPGKTWRWLNTWLGCAFALRASISLAGDFVIHPDEIYQYLEPAHWLVFGNGVFTVDYFFGFRSWLIPGLVAGLLWLSNAAGIGEPWFYTYAVKLMFCLLSLLIPWGIYHYSRHVINETTARLATIFACVWPYLIIYAHKPLTESVATSLLIGALGLAAVSGMKRPFLATGAGILLTLTALIRIQYAPIALFVWVGLFIALKRRAALAMLIGSLMATTLVAILEWYGQGGFFTSYTNYLQANVALNTERVSQPYHYYVSRLIYASCGGLLLAIWVMVKQPKTYLLIGTSVLIGFVFHAFVAGHQEFRFVFLLLVLTLIPMAGWFDLRAKHRGKPLNIVLSAGAAATFSVLVLFNLLPFESYLHGKSDLNYLRGQNNLFAIYRELATSDDVSAVVHVPEIYRKTPLYYYLHRRVPFYDRRMSLILADESGLKLDQLASHVVTDNRLLDENPHFTLLQDSGEYKLYRNNTNNPVISWQQYRIWDITPRTFIFYAATFDDLRPNPKIDELFTSHVN